MLKSKTVPLLHCLKVKLNTKKPAVVVEFKHFKNGSHGRQ